MLTANFDAIFGKSIIPVRSVDGLVLTEPNSPGLGVLAVACDTDSDGPPASWFIPAESAGPEDFGRELNVLFAAALAVLEPLTQCLTWDISAGGILHADGPHVVGRAWVVRQHHTLIPIAPQPEPEREMLAAELRAHGIRPTNRWRMETLRAKAAGLLKQPG